MHLTGNGVNHGVDFSNPFFLAWCVIVPAAHVFLIFLFRSMGLWNFKTRGGSRASDIMAFEIVAGLCVAYLATAGFIGTFGLFGFSNELERLQKASNHFYASSQYVEDHLVYPMIAYQAWNFLLSILVSDFRDPAMVGHHLITGSLAYFGLYPYIHFKALFFFGVAEFTNVPLTVVDTFKYFPDLAKKYSALNEFSRYLFALSFVVLRLIVWPYCCYDFWVGSVDLLRSGKAHSSFVVAFFLGANVFLTGLQYFW
jgi:hypothetical protein